MNKGRIAAVGDNGHGSTKTATPTVVLHSTLHRNGPKWSAAQLVSINRRDEYRNAYYERLWQLVTSRKHSRNKCLPSAQIKNIEAFCSCIPAHVRAFSGLSVEERRDSK